MLIVFIVSDKICINTHNKKRGNKNSMTVNGRLRYVRKKLLCLTQAELADDLGIKESTVGSMERNGRNVTEQTLKHFCLRYGINEEWLRTGGGKIFVEQNTLDAFATAHKVSEFEIEIFKKFLCIEPDSRHIILKKMQEIFN